MGLFTKHWIGILGGLAAAAVANPAQAQEYGTDGGLYWSLRGGLSQVRHFVEWDWLKIDPIYDTATPSTVLARGVNSHNELRSLEMDYGYVVGTAVGYTLTYPDHPATLRLEVEAIYRKNEDGEINSEWFATSDNPDSDSFAHVTAPIIGTLEVSSAMVNVLMEFNNPSRFSPYFGLGAGVSRIEATGLIYDTNRAPWLGLPQAFDDDIYALSWQAIVGIGYHLTPGTVATLEFRHFKLAADRWSDLFYREELQNVKFDDWSVGLRFTF